MTQKRYCLQPPNRSEGVPFLLNEDILLSIPIEYPPGEPDLIHRNLIIGLMVRIGPDNLNYKHLFTQLKTKCYGNREIRVHLA